VVSEICAGGYGAGRAGEGSTKGSERLVARPTAYSSLAMAKAIGEGPKAMKLSIVEIFTALERTKRCAHAWAQSQPEHDEALGKFIKDLDQIGLELKNSVLVKARFRSSRHESTVEGNLFGIVNCLVPVITFAVIISERQPEYTVPLKRFQEEVQRVRQELIKKVRPGVGVLSDEE
jgi:hypothetical protein